MNGGRMSRYRRFEVLAEIRSLAISKGEVLPEDLIRKYRIAYSTAITWMKEAAAIFDDVVYDSGRLIPKVE